LSEPKHWSSELSGQAKAAIAAYLDDRMSGADLAVMRAYLKQWIKPPVWEGGAAVDRLRAEVDNLATRAAVAEWLDAAEDLGIDPL
jgi:hypothetical protein